MKFYNTLSGSLETFKPIAKNTVSLYTCGPTVYDYLHVGNWTAYVYWDVLVRSLRANGYTVERVMNITDVGHLVSDADDGEDKLEKGARREGKTAWQIAEFYTDDFLAGMQQLNLLAPDHLTKATDYISEQLELVRQLKDKGYTYQIDDGIYFDTAKFPSYADFARLNIEAQKAGARVETNLGKRQPSDFALWKFSPKNSRRDMEWLTPAELLDDDHASSQSPVMGFPGWHLECSAMAMSIFGATIDIHTGGIDHIPVHHTNEIAQSEAATGERFSNYWLHANHLKVNGTKISKSLGNGFTLQNLEAEGYSALDLKMAILQGHYRSEGNFTFESLSAARSRRHNWQLVAALRHQIHDSKAPGSPEPDAELTELVNQACQEVLKALANDLDTPSALARVDKIFTKLQSARLAMIDRQVLLRLLELIDQLLGLKLLELTPDIDDSQKLLISQRQAARQVKDWKESDRLRDELARNGLELSDQSHQSSWHYSEVQG